MWTNRPPPDYHEINPAKPQLNGRPDPQPNRGDTATRPTAFTALTSGPVTVSTSDPFGPRPTPSRPGFHRAGASSKEFIMMTGISRRRLGFSVTGGIVAGCATALIAAAGFAGSSSPSTPTADTQQSWVSMWVDGGALAGLSPASVRLAATFVDPIDQSAIGAWADPAGLVGSSPSSLRMQALAPSIDQSAVAVWANTQGLSGLSPASVFRTED
jgi:hypothetical protein